jgi:hypothetical protein
MCIYRTPRRVSAAAGSFAFLASCTWPHDVQRRPTFSVMAAIFAPHRLQIRITFDWWLLARIPLPSALARISVHADSIDVAHIKANRVRVISRPSDPSDVPV